MIISRTPFRISFFGGGTDYPDWSKEHGGAVLSTSFDKYTYVTCRVLPPFFDHTHRIIYSKVENVRALEEIEHPAIRAVIKETGIETGLEIHVNADLPARSGLGSSSTFVVGLLHALSALQGRMASKEWLAREAIRIEQKVLRENVGSQDQVAASYGGMNLIHFHTDGGIQVQPVPLPKKRRHELEDHLQLYFTGFSRFASEIAHDQIKNMPSKVGELTTMRAMVDEGVKVLVNGKDLRGFGELLHAAWIHKRSLSSKVSTSQIDAMYEAARKAGAIGGKLLGAGGGGFLLLFVEPERQKTVKEALNGLIQVPFKFESSGSQVIYYQS